MGARRPAATVSAPGLDRGYETPGVALSAAITFATRANVETTIYVRDTDDSPYGRVERDALGGLLIYRTAAAR